MSRYELLGDRLRLGGSALSVLVVRLLLTGELWQLLLGLLRRLRVWVALLLLHLLRIRMLLLWLMRVLLLRLRCQLSLTLIRSLLVAIGRHEVRIRRLLLLLLLLLSLLLLLLRLTWSLGGHLLLVPDLLDRRHVRQRVRGRRCGRGRRSRLGCGRPWLNGYRGPNRTPAHSRSNWRPSGSGGAPSSNRSRGDAPSWLCGGQRGCPRPRRGHRPAPASRVHGRDRGRPPSPATPRNRRRRASPAGATASPHTAAPAASGRRRQALLDGRVGGRHFGRCPASASGCCGGSSTRRRASSSRRSLHGTGSPRRAPLMLLRTHGHPRSRRLGSRLNGRRQSHR